MKLINVRLVILGVWMVLTIGLSVILAGSYFESSNIYKKEIDPNYMIDDQYCYKKFITNEEQCVGWGVYVYYGSGAEFRFIASLMLTLMSVSGWIIFLYETQRKFKFVWSSVTNGSES